MGRENLKIRLYRALTSLLILIDSKQRIEKFDKWKFFVATRLNILKIRLLFEKSMV